MPYGDGHEQYARQWNGYPRDGNADVNASDARRRYGDADDVGWRRYATLTCHADVDFSGLYPATRLLDNASIVDRGPSPWNAGHARHLPWNQTNERSPDGFKRLASCSDHVSSTSADECNADSSSTHGSDSDERDASTYDGRHSQSTWPARP